MVDAMQGWYDQLVANIRAGDAGYLQRQEMGSLELAEEAARASASWRRRVVPWPTGS
jgi:hypothetical protein